MNMKHLVNHLDIHYVLKNNTLKYYIGVSLADTFLYLAVNFL